MAKYLIEAAYTAEGLRGLSKDKASGRKAAIEATLANMGGKLEGMYFAFGENDVYVLCDFPSNLSAAALGIMASSSGMVRTKITPLLTVEETDEVLTKKVSYRPPGS